MWLMYQSTENLIHKEVPKWQRVSVHRYEPHNILKSSVMQIQAYTNNGTKWEIQIREWSRFTRGWMAQLEEGNI